MSDSERDSDVLNDKKDNNDLDHSSHLKSTKRRTRRSMDFELHDPHEYNNNYGEDSDNNDGGGKCNHLGKDELVKSTESTRACDFDSDEDTFADADSDCEPNQYYLDEMLEDIHPERLNLLEYRKKKQNKSHNYYRSSSSIPSISEAQYDENDDNDSEYSFNKNLEGSFTSRLDDNDNDGDSGGDGRDKFGSKGNLNPDESEHETDRVDENEDVTDTFGSLPTATREKGKRRSRMGLNNFGSSANAAGPGSPILRQPSCKAYWGK